MAPQRAVMGTWEQRAVCGCIAFWYTASCASLLLNKYLLSTLHTPPDLLASAQMVTAVFCGALQTYALPSLSGALSGSSRDTSDGPKGTVRGPAVRGGGGRRGLAQLGLVGALRFAAMTLNLLSLKLIAASFMETIKSTAPFFTVVIAYVVLGESTPPLAVLALIPVAGGLVMVSVSELSFNYGGFIAAISANTVECLQNVLSKRLLGEDYTASQLQFYTSLMALVLQVQVQMLQQQGLIPGVAPISMVQPGGPLTTPRPAFHELAGHGPATTRLPAAFLSSTPALLCMNGLLCHAQSLAAYKVMSHLSPVTVSVVNTVKRAMIIWISVIVFGNPVTSLAKVGTAVCLLGVLGYNVARARGAEA